MKYFQSSSYPIEFVLSENIDKRYHTHNHANHWVLTTVISGNIAVEISDNRTECMLGEYFIVPPYVPHAVSLNKDAKILSLCVQRDFFEQCDLTEMKSIVRIYMDELCKRKVMQQAIFYKTFGFEKIEWSKHPAFEAGTISVMPAKVKHEVNAGDEGLCLFANLCRIFPVLLVVYSAFLSYPKSFKKHSADFISSLF